MRSSASAFKDALPIVGLSRAIGMRRTTSNTPCQLGHERAASQPLAGPSGQADAPARLGALEACPRAHNQLGCCAPGTVLAQPTTNIREGAQAPSLHAQHSHLRWHHQPCAREPRLVQHTADVTMGARPSHRWWQGGALSSESAMRSQNG